VAIAALPGADVPKVLLANRENRAFVPDLGGLSVWGRYPEVWGHAHTLRHTFDPGLHTDDRFIFFYAAYSLP